QFDGIDPDVPKSRLLEDELQLAAVGEREDPARCSRVLCRDLDVLADSAHRQRNPWIALGRPPDRNGDAPARLERLVRLIEELQGLRHEHYAEPAGDRIERSGLD